jgi:DNA-binding MarR family transcriptional regulator
VSINERNCIISYEHTGNSTLRVITDKRTGEVLSQDWINTSKVKPGRPNKQDAHFIKLYRTNLIDIVKYKKLDLNEAGLLFLILSLIGWQTPYIINPSTGKNMSAAEIATYLSMDRSHISDILDRLTAKGIITKVSRGNGRSNHYMINVNIAFYGKTIDDINHINVFKDCAYEPKLEIKYKQSPSNNK